MVLPNLKHEKAHVYGAGHVGGIVTNKIVCPRFACARAPN